MKPPTESASRALLASVLAGGLLLVALLAAAVAYRHGAFERTTDIYVLADSAAGLAPGTGVRLSGVRIGEVYSLTLMPDLRVRVALRIGAEHFPSLRKDARALLVREQLRPPVIELDPGRHVDPLDPEQRELGFHGRATLTEIADELRGRLLPILDDLKTVTGMLRERQGDVAQVLANAAAASGELAKSAAEVHAIAANARQQLDAIGRQSQTLLTSGNTAFAKVGTTLDQLNVGLTVVNSALPALLKKTDDTLGNLNAVARDTRAIASAAAETLPVVLRAGPPMVEETRDLVQGLRQSWPLRALLPAPPPAEVPIASHDAAALRRIDAR